MRKLSEAEWISRFEQVQGRNPKPDELQLAYQSGLIEVSKNYNYIYILLGSLLAIVVAIGISLISGTTHQQSEGPSTMASTLFASTGISSDNSSASASENPRWTNDKGSRLANLMVSWGNQMNQPGYQEITKEASTIPIHWGSDRDQVVDATYAANGNSSSEYTIVSVYERWQGTTVHRYFFSIKRDGTPVVLYSSTTNCSIYYVKETGNENLKSAYADIVSN